jgi:hypothetical protein
MEGWLSLLPTDVGGDAWRPHYYWARTTSSCRISSWLSKARNLISSVLHFRMDVRASVPLCKSGLRALYTLANSSRSEPLVDSSARNASSVRFAGLEVHHSASTITVRW